MCRVKNRKQSTVYILIRNYFLKKYSYSVFFKKKIKLVKKNAMQIENFLKNKLAALSIPKFSCCL